MEELDKVIANLENAFSYLNDKLSDLKAYKSKLEIMEVQHKNMRDYLKEKGLEKEYLQVKEKPQKTGNQEFKEL